MAEKKNVVKTTQRKKRTIKKSQTKSKKDTIGYPLMYTSIPFYTLFLVTSLCLFFVFVLFYSINIHFGANDTPKIENREDSTIEQVVKKKEVCEKTEFLTGNCLGNDLDQTLYAAVIENHYDSRPLSGIANSHMVFEFLVEGGITRLLALYTSDQDIKKIGPIRSARPYFLEIAKPYNALFAHVGGSPQALEMIQTQNINDFNEYARGNYFWRDKTRFAPHNVYTSIELLSKGCEIFCPKEYDDLPSTLLTYSDKILDENDNNSGDSMYATEVFIPYSTSVYNVKWVYDQENGNYDRYQLGKKDRDSSQNEIKVENIIVLKADTDVIDSVGRLNIDLNGTGSALYFIDGFVYTGFWKKESLAEPITFFDKDMNEFDTFKTGKTWINVVDAQNTIEYK